MTPLDEDLSARLRSLPASAQRPLGAIEARARVLRRRRRAGGVSVALAVTAITAVASASWWDAPNRAGVGPAGHSSVGPVECPQTVRDAQEVVDQAVNDGSYPVADISDLPERLRLLWSESEAPAPETATAYDATQAATLLAPYEEACPALPMQDVTFVDVEGSSVTRAVSVIYVDVGYVRDRAAEARTLEAGSTVVSVTHRDAGKDLVTASWGTAEGSWTVVGNPLSDAEIIELVEAARIEQGGIVVNPWSVGAEAEHVVPGTAGNAAVGGVFYDVSNDTALLAVEDNRESLWQRARPGDQVIQVNGKPGLLHVESHAEAVAWQLAEGVVASVTTYDGTGTTLEIAESVTPAPADDPRLIGSWQGDRVS